MTKRADGKFKRHPKDLYDTPRPPLLPLLPFLAPRTRFVEPCAGRGALIDLLVAEGHHCVWATDIDPQRVDIGRLDALTLPQIKRRNIPGDVLITNPPWRRDILHPLIDSLSGLMPCWFLFDSDWASTSQAAELLMRCARIIPVGRVKWIPGTKHVGFDNCAWYEFLPGHETGPQLLPRGAVPTHVLMGPEERRRAEIAARGVVAPPGPLFEGANGGTPTKGPMQVVQPPAETQQRAHEPDARPLSDPEESGRHRDGASVQTVQRDQGQHASRDVARVHGSASAMVAKLRKGLRTMVRTRITPGDL